MVNSNIINNKHEQQQHSYHYNQQSLMGIYECCLGRRDDEEAGKKWMFNKTRFFHSDFPLTKVSRFCL